MILIIGNNDLTISTRTLRSVLNSLQILIADIQHSITHNKVFTYHISCCSKLLNFQQHTALRVHQPLSNSKHIRIFIRSKINHASELIFVEISNWNCLLTVMISAKQPSSFLMKLTFRNSLTVNTIRNTFYRHLHSFDIRIQVFLTP